MSDFDILIVTKYKNSPGKSRNYVNWNRAAGSEELMANDKITRTSISYRSIGFVNDKIERDYYFFVDILKEGVVLFDSGKFS